MAFCHNILFVDSISCIGLNIRPIILIVLLQFWTCKFLILTHALHLCKLIVTNPYEVNPIHGMWCICSSTSRDPLCFLTCFSLLLQFIYIVCLLFLLPKERGSVSDLPLIMFLSLVFFLMKREKHWLKTSKCYSLSFFYLYFHCARLSIYFLTLNIFRCILIKNIMVGY